MTVLKITNSLFTLLAYLFSALLLFGCGGGGGDGGGAPVTSTISISSLDITTVGKSLKVSETFQLTVTGAFSDGSTQNLTSQVTWSVDDSAVFEVSNAGLVTALSAGTSDVTAAFEGQSIETNILVKALTDLKISPSSATLAIATSEKLTVTGLYSDNSNETLNSLVTWESSDVNVATISNFGLVIAVSTGETLIRANIGELSSSLRVTVSPATLQSIEISSPMTQIASGLTTTFSAKGIYSDGTEQNLSDQVVWSVSDSAIASINAETGLLTALQPGTSLVNAGKEGQTRSLEITVSPASLSSIAITPSDISLAKGSSEPVNVTASFSDNTKQDVSSQVDWVNSNDQIAIIKDDLFTVQALLEGSTTLSASLLGEQADLSITVTNAELVSLALNPINASIPLGQSQQYYAQGTFADGTVQDLTSEVTWISSNEDRVLINNTDSLAGLAESVALGSTKITVALGDIQQDTLLTIGNVMLSSIQVQPVNQVIAKGSDAEIKALGYFTDGSLIDLTSKVIWTASRTKSVDVISVSNGTVLSLSEGSALISAKLDGVVGLGNIKVTDATLQSLAISATQTAMTSGITQQLVATGTYSDMSTRNLNHRVNWQSDDALKATVSNANSNSGLLRAISPGQVTISVSLGSLSNQINIDVTDAELTGIQINSPNSQINVTSTQLVTAIATFSDSSAQDVSTQVNWLSSDTSIASIGNAEFDKGFVTALSAGMVNISASLQGIKSSTTPLEIILNPNFPRALNLSVHPNMILNDSSDTSQISLVLVPSKEAGVIADGTPVTLTITEGDINRDVNLVTTNGKVNYSLQSSYDGFISLSATASGYSVDSGLSSANDLANAFYIKGQGTLVYENNTLKAGSVLYLLLRNLTNRVFIVDQINVGYLDPNNNNDFVNFPDSPITSGAIISDGDLTAGEFNAIGYELDNDTESSIFVFSHLITDEQSSTSFRITNSFNLAQ
ncbi:Ig-like domain-containing protein [Paraglaciecola psychrophila]|uniref:BIG2 domain-containing protein n=1 Tax=Paraglaciecola psychrophila 170 TaxID=1129794 RepID=K6ZV79_9ALTE|nr:Ig-like domain-containing protein [Paraglaciecola psychrophila]AGH45991.1 hypothetical protein C427_3886 [Paraglaciecola psychrophila 170]GAC39776.1 hypothetical protein GPSY_4165 [Paraglaciecola psychrophila 170]